MIRRRNIFALLLLSIAALLVTAACGSSAATTTTPQKTTAPRLSAIVTPRCTAAQSRLIHQGTRRTTVWVRSYSPLMTNTHPTAPRIKVDTLLILKLRRHGLRELDIDIFPHGLRGPARNAGCLAKHDSHVKDGTLTAAFLMTKLGYPVVQSNGPPPPNGALAGLHETFVHVVTQ